MQEEKIQKKNLIYDNRRYITGCLGVGVEKGMNYKGAQGNFWGLMDTFCLLTIVVILQVHTPAKINQIGHFKWIQIII